MVMSGKVCGTLGSCTELLSSVNDLCNTNFGLHSARKSSSFFNLNTISKKDCLRMETMSKICGFVS